MVVGHYLQKRNEKIEAIRRKKNTIFHFLVGSLRNDDGKGDEDVTPKHKFTLFAKSKNCFKSKYKIRTNCRSI